MECLARHTTRRHVVVWLLSLTLQSPSVCRPRQTSPRRSWLPPLPLALLAISPWHSPPLLPLAPPFSSDIPPSFLSFSSFSSTFSPQFFSPVWHSPSFSILHPPSILLHSPSPSLSLPFLPSPFSFPLALPFFSFLPLFFSPFSLPFLLYVPMPLLFCLIPPSSPT